MRRGLRQRFRTVSTYGKAANRTTFLALRMGAIGLGIAFLISPEGWARQAVERISFARHVVDATAGGYQVSAADVDGDGRSDILALATQPSRLSWYRNPDWLRSEIAVGTERNIDLAPGDADRDGRIDLAVGAGFDLGDSRTPGPVVWIYPTDDSPRAWAAATIAEEITPHRLRWTDVDGDGRPELLSLPLLGHGAEAPTYGSAGASLRLYVPPAHPNRDPWRVVTVDTTLRIAHGMRPVDWDHDGREDLLSASQEGVTLFRSLSEGGVFAWEKRRLVSGAEGSPPNRGASEVALGRLDTSGTAFLATIEPWHGNVVAVYLPLQGDAEGYRRIVVDSTLVDGHALLALDLDGDQRDEIVAGQRGRPFGLYLYRSASADGLLWTRHPIDTDMAAAGLYAADLNADGRVDLMAIGAGSNNVVWYENLGR